VLFTAEGMALYKENSVNPEHLIVKYMDIAVRMPCTRIDNDSGKLE
jgi:hypothetical protein